MLNVPVQQGEDEAEGDADELCVGEDSEEGGVSSVVSSTEQQAGRGRSINKRAAIMVDTGAGGGSASTGQQRLQPGARRAEEVGWHRELMGILASCIDRVQL